jgi:GT2 family glycosyltransferase
MKDAAGTPSVSILIVTWNGKHYALECLESLRAMESSLSLEVIVVDNASSDGTPEAIARLYPEVKLLRNALNLGFAKANNIGIAASTGDYVALVNSDVVLPPRCLDNIVGFMEKNPDIGLLGPRMLIPGGAYGQSVYRLPTIWNSLCTALAFHRLFQNSHRFGGYDMHGYSYEETEDVEVLTGWFWVVPRRALGEVGGLDERFFMYGEDWDWSYRFHKHGWRVVFYSGAEALHYGAASSAANPTLFYLEKVIANSQYFRKHYGSTGRWAFLFITVLHELVRVLGHSLSLILPSHSRSRAATKIRNSVCCLRWVLMGYRPARNPGLAHS